MPDQTPGMPPMPEPYAVLGRFVDSRKPVYTSDQMLAFRADGIRAALTGVVDALEAGHDALAAEAKEYHAAMAGYRPHIHQAMDAEVASVKAVLERVRADFSTLSLAGPK